MFVNLKLVRKCLPCICNWLAVACLFLPTLSTWYHSTLLCTLMCCRVLVYIEWIWSSFIYLFNCALWFHCIWLWTFFYTASNTSLDLLALYICRHATEHILISPLEYMLPRIILLFVCSLYCIFICASLLCAVLHCICIMFLQSYAVVMLCDLHFSSFSSEQLPLSSL